MSMPETENIDSWEAMRFRGGAGEESEGEVGVSGWSVSRVDFCLDLEGLSDSSRIVEWLGGMRSRLLRMESRFVLVASGDGFDL